MRCQLAVFKNNEAHPERIGWFVWVVSSPPQEKQAIAYATGLPLMPFLYYETPYIAESGPAARQPVLIRHKRLELLPIFDDVPAHWHENWVARRGEPDPQLVEDIAHDIV